MNYKRLLPNKKMRMQLLRYLDIIPDRWMIAIQYWIATGHLLHFKKPIRFTEKIQWYKLYYRDELMTICADKYQVRSYVKQKGYEHLLVPLLAFYTSPEEIDFKALPESFVLKTTNGSKTNILCQDKTTLDELQVKRQLADYLKQWSGKVGREWAYYNVPGRIVCETLLVEYSPFGLADYKFYCFYGEPRYIYVAAFRHHPDGIAAAYFDLQFQRLPFFSRGVRKLPDDFPKPENLQKMLCIAADLSRDFPHVRVDLYSCQQRIYFGELTFYDASGYDAFYPDNMDFVVGEYFHLPEKRNEVSYETVS